MRSGYRTFDRTYERILLTLPFTTLRLVQLDVDLPAFKKKAIAQLGYGTNAKLITAYQQRLWRTQYNSTGEVAARRILKDLGFRNISASQESINTNQLHRYRKIPRAQRFSDDFTQ